MSGKQGNRKYFFNEHFLDEIDTPEKAYFLGWAYSDGYHSEKNKRFRLSLQSRDCDVLELLTNILESTYPIRLLERQNPKWQDQKLLEVGSVHFSSKLCEYGVKQAKSLSLKIPIEKFPDHLIKFLLRGWFEGDGHLSFGTRKKGGLFVSLNIPSGSDECANQLKTLIENFSGEKISLYKYGKYNRLAMPSHRNAFRFIKWLYSDREDLCLKRKYETSMSFLKFYETIYENGKDKTHQVITDEMKGKMIFLRGEGKFISEIAKDIGVVNASVFNFLKKEESYKNLRIKYTINLNRLLPSKDKENSYLLGYLFSKANLNLGNQTLTVSSSNIKKVVFLNELLENTNPIYEIRNSYKLKTSGKSLFEQLSKVGISGSKNSDYSIDQNLISSVDFKYFLIGLFDARGSFRSRKERREFTLVLRVHQEFLAEKIKDYIFEQTGVVLNIKKRRDEMTFLRTCGTNNPKKIIDFLFSGEDSFGQFFKAKCDALL